MDFPLVAAVLRRVVAAQGAGEQIGDAAIQALASYLDVHPTQADPALHHMLDELLPDTIAGLLASELEYGREFAALYGPGLEAMSEGDFVSAAPGSHFGPED